ncbi:MAG: HAMP domain-containing histidine kinase, partial [Bacilli bacterium]|nr:HAMP domain-containing histidine kinase [Bacilli bacterium]
WASLGGGIGGVLLSFLILLFVSKKFVKPIEESDRRQKLFIADASQSLKDPVTVIGLNNDLAIMKNGESEEGTAISKQVGKLTKIITELNELAALEKVNEVPGEIFDFSSLVSLMVNEYAPKFEQAHKQLVFDNLQPGLEFKGDQEQFRHLFEVILDNAMKYSFDKAELNLTSQEGRIALTLKNEANYELPEGDLDLYFERFIRGEGLKEANIPGSGIGLSIARDIIKIYNGRISASGKDKVFTLKIEL